MNIIDYIVVKGLLKQPQSKSQSNQPEFDPSRLGPKQVYMAWQAAGRPAQQFGSKKMTRSFGIIGVVVALFLVILQEYFLILVVASLVFVSQVLAKTPPENTSYELSSYGITIDGQVYYWHELRRFFFFNHADGHSGIMVDLVAGFPTRLFLMLDSAQHPAAKEILSQHLQYLESEPETILDRTYKSVTDKFNS
jgi:hypothetical protein